MKEVLRSVKPYWLYLILTGKKTVEIGKSCPQAKDWNKVVEVYCSKDMRSFNRIPEEDKEWMRKYLGKVIGEFICDKVEKFEEQIEEGGLYYTLRNDFNEATQLDNWELHDYGKGKPIYAWHISQLKIYDKPKELSEFFAKCRIPESKCKCCDYCSELEDRYGRFYNIKRVIRPPQSWMYIEG